jgi:hypothetical protein
MAIELDIFCPGLMFLPIDESILGYHRSACGKIGLRSVMVPIAYTTSS